MTRMSRLLLSELFGWQSKIWQLICDDWGKSRSGCVNWSGLHGEWWWDEENGVIGIRDFNCRGASAPQQWKKNLFFIQQEEDRFVSYQLGVTRTMWFIGTFDLEAGPSLADCNKVKHSFFDFKFYVVFLYSQLLKFVLLKTVRHDAGSGMLGLQRSPWRCRSFVIVILECDLEANLWPTGWWSRVGGIIGAGCLTILINYFIKIKK